MHAFRLRKRLLTSVFWIRRTSSTRTKSSAMPASPTKSHGRGRMDKEIVNLTGDSDSTASPEPRNEKVLQSRALGENTIDLTAEADETASAEAEDDEDLRRAIALSLEGTQVERLSKFADVSSSARSMLPGTAPLSGILGIDRKTQEQERLARLKRKRERSISPPALLRQGNTGQIVDRSIENRVKSDTPPTVSSRNGTSIFARPSTTSTPSIPILQFPGGIVKQTWAFGYPRNGKDIKIEEVLQRSALEAAVLSAFQWDYDWLFPKLDLKRTSLVLVMQAKYQSRKEDIKSDFKDIHNVRLCFPSMEGQINCMHSKLMLLFYQKSMRIVVPTANLVPYDWGECDGVMENTVFVIDLPRSDSATTKRPAFETDLLYYLEAKGLPNDVVRRVQEHDFAKTAELAFVHTIGGVHTGDSWRLTGHCGLGRAIAALGLNSIKPLKLDFVTSSIGSLNDEFMRSIYLAAQGDDGLSEYTLRTAKSFPMKSVGNPGRLINEDAGAEWKKNFRFFYPSDATVRASKGGPDSAGTICFQEKWWTGSRFPQSNMYDCPSRRSGLLSHNKVRFLPPFEMIMQCNFKQLIFARFGAPLTTAELCKGWVYVGSSNLSESAWSVLSNQTGSWHHECH